MVYGFDDNLNKIEVKDKASQETVDAGQDQRLSALESGKADKSQIPDVSGFATKTELAGKSDVGHGHDNYALKTEISETPIITVGSIAKQYAKSSSDSVSDVTEWVQKNVSGWNQRQRGCAYGNGWYVIAGAGGSVAVSRDGINWTAVTPFLSGTITSVVYGGGRFVLVDSGSIWTATDPSGTWTKELDLPALASGFYYEGLVYSGGMFILVGGGGLIMTSPDAKKWKTAETGTANDFYAITYGNGLFCAVGKNGQVSISVTGEVWEDVSDPSFTTQLRAITCGNGVLVAGGQGGVMRYSHDGRTWHSGSFDSTSSVNYIRGIAYRNGRFYAVMYISTGKGEIWTSKDGVTWTVDIQTPARLWCIAVGDDVFFASGDSGNIHILDMGIEWSNVPLEVASSETLWSREVYNLTDGTTAVGEVEQVLDVSGKADVGHTHSEYALKSDVPTITISTADPSGGKDGDIWFKYKE